MNKKGFTLVEVLVSLALVSTIAIFLFQIIFIIRDIYAEKNIKSEIYIESSNVSNVINKDIFNKDKDGIYIKNINKVSNDELYITYSDGTKNNIVIDRSNNTITYGNYTVSILDVAKIGNIEMYYNYETTDLNKNGICYIKIPITHDDYKNDFGIVITYRYNSSRTKINGEITIAPGGEEETCNVAANTTWTFDYTGDVQEFTSPCAGYYKLEVWGAQGGTASGQYGSVGGGSGGYSYGTANLESGQPIYIVVGGQGSGGRGRSGSQNIPNGGYNGGGSGRENYGNENWGVAGGGGATHIGKTSNILKDTAQADVYLVAGGGGGGIIDSWVPTRYYAGVGGGTEGTGGGGSQSAAGQGGGYGYGGNAGWSWQDGWQGGGGGGGYYGGGWHSYNEGKGGGGGSGYIGGVTDGETIAGNATMPTHDGSSTMTGNSGNGYAKITLVSY